MIHSFNTLRVKDYLNRLDAGLRGSGTRLKSPHLKDSELPHSTRYFLAAFDKDRGAELEQEATRFLADGGSTLTANQNLPVGWQRAILKEALADTAILDLVQTLSYPGMSSSVSIPYEVRKIGTVVNGGIVYEGAQIPRYSIEQKMDLAYVNATKLSISISNECAFFSANASADWDMLSRAIASNAALVSELLARRIANELQRSSDAYQAVAISDEDIAAQLTGTESLIKTAEWPVVRPHQTRDLAGNAVGAVEGPLTLTLDAAEIEEWDGTGDQSAGTYYRVESWNLGKIRLVDESGDAVTPAPTTATLSYSHATNIDKFDMDVPEGTTEENHLNGALRAFGARIAFMKARRFTLPEWTLTSPILHAKLSDASQFAAASLRAGSSLAPDGSLGEVKRVPVYASTGTSDLGDERIQFARLESMTYAVARPFQTGPTFEGRGPNGLPNGTKICYGEEYSAIHVPLPLRAGLTSLICYSATEREAAV